MSWSGEGMGLYPLGWRVAKCETGSGAERQPLAAR
jgi:hypothetical protein